MSVLMCPKCEKLENQIKVGEYVFECQYCKHLYKKENAILKLDDEDIQIIDSKQGIIENLPSNLCDNYLSLSAKKQKYILYKLATDMEQKDIAVKIEVDENTLSNWNKNKLIRMIIDYFKMEQVKEVRQLAISKTVELTNYCLDELRSEIKSLSGKDKINAIKIALEYDSKNKTNQKYNDDALDNSLI